MDSTESDGAPKRADTGMAWGLKNSFVGYLTSLPDSQVRLSDGAAVTATREFYFPLTDASEFDPVNRTGRARFGGALRFSGHFGALDLTIADPWISFNEASAVLSFLSETNTRVPLVTLDVGEPVDDGEVLMWLNAPTRLAIESVLAFNGVYGPNEAFDPITVRVPRPLLRGLDG